MQTMSARKEGKSCIKEIDRTFQGIYDGAVLVSHASLWQQKSGGKGKKATRYVTTVIFL